MFAQTPYPFAGSGGGSGGGGGGSGTVTSVGAPTADFTVTDPTVAADIAWKTKTANFVLAGPTSGGAATPAFRALVAADIPSLPTSIITSGTFAKSLISTTGTWTAAEIPSLDAAKITTGTLVVAQGGTGAASFTAYSVICGGTTSTGAHQNVSGLGTSGQVLTSNGAGALPTWQTVSGTGSVTSVAMTVPSILSVAGSPVTTSGTLAVTLANQNANLCFAGPSSGGAAAPTFRALVAADIPTLTATTYVTMSTARLLGRTTASTGAAEEITVGTGITLATGALSLTAHVVRAESDGATVTITASNYVSGQKGYGTVTIAGNRTLSFSGGTSGQMIELIVKQDGTGSRTLTADSSVEFGTDITDLTGISATAGKETSILFIYRGSTSKWRPLAINKGF